MKAVLSRLWISLALGIAFGFLCAYLAYSNGTTEALDLHSPVFWSILYNRFLIGFVVFLAGFMQTCPLTGLRFPTWLRGAKMGAIVSLAMAIGILIDKANPDMWMIFWSTIIAGIVYGAIIDVVATKWGGEGKELLV